MRKPKPAQKKRLKLKVIVIAALSLLIASALELYTFGLATGFFTRWLRFFFVVFLLTGITTLGIVPGVNYAVNRIVRKFS